jgi:hypothetical protein
MNDPTKKVFMLTDGCMWEKNKEDGTAYPHAVEVVDVETGQVRYIKSGSRIKFLDGEITEGRDQESYNRQEKQ